jgi:hypothetical protein
MENKIAIHPLSKWRGILTKIKFNENKVLFSDATDFEDIDNDRGGIIVFPLEVREDKIIKWVKQEMFKHRFTIWTVGYFFKGRYGGQYGKDSVSVEIIGIGFDEIKNIIKDCIEETILIKEYEGNRVFIMSN